MVRLKLLGYSGLEGSVIKFQSHNGSIKTRQEKLLSMQIPANFNPTMVRLKRFLLNNWFVMHCKFQSHNGSIKTKGVCREEFLQILISIPQWFD